MKKTSKQMVSLALAMILLLALLPGGALAASLTVSSLNANKSSAVTGDSVTWTAAAAGGSGTIRYCFYVFKNGKIAERGSYGTAKTYTYTPTSAGTYTVRVYVKDGAGTVATKEGAAVTVSAGALTILSLTADKAQIGTGETVTWTAAASGGSGTLRYCFYVFKNGKIEKRGSYGTAKTYTYTPTSAGTYTVRVYVKDAAGTVETLTGGQVKAVVPITVTSLEPSSTWGIVSMGSDWEVTATGGVGPLEYCFYFFWNGKLERRGSWQSERWDSCHASRPGRYTCRVYVRDSAGTVVSYESESWQDFSTAEDSTIYITGLEPDKTYDWESDITWTATAHGGFPYNNLEYCFYIFWNGRIMERSSWQTSNTYTHNANIIGDWTARVYVRDSIGQQEVYNSPTAVIIHGV